LTNRFKIMALRTENTRAASGIPQGKRGTTVRRPVFQNIANKPVLAESKNGGKAVLAKPRQAKVSARRLLASPVLQEMEVDIQANTDYEAVVEERLAALTVKLPAGVVDIDDEDVENPQLCSEYAKEMYSYLRVQEAKFSVRSNYLTGCPTTGKMRTVLVDWLIDVQQQFKLLQETLYLSVSIIDRFLNKEGLHITRSRLQLVGIAAMFIASKIEEIYAPELNDFVYITDNAYEAAEVRAMELRIIKALGCNLGDPLSINFLRRFSKAGDVDVTQHALAKYILETILLDYTLVSLSPSMKAATSLYLSLGILEERLDVWSPALHFYSGYTREEVHIQVKSVAECLKRAHTGKFTAVKTKYSAKQMMKIALNTEISDKLAEL